MTLTAPFPFFGGKSKVAALAWQRFGDVSNYIEPFFGSGAVLLARPHDPRIETVNDLDCYVANFYRALQHDPETVTHWADWPVNEADLHARHWWLVRQAGFREKMHSDPDYYDVKIAGWWVWGICQWIGSGWCHYPEWQQLPHLGDSGRGVHRPSQQLPLLRHKGLGVNSQVVTSDDLYGYMLALAERLRKVRVCCGDWERICGPTPTYKQGLTGVFLDPPYVSAHRDNDLYAVDSLEVGHRVAAWCIAEIEDKQIRFKGPRYLHPKMRIALCGYEGDYEMPDDWDCVPWKAGGGYSSQNQNGNDNPHRERIWFSPHCINKELATPYQMSFAVGQSGT